MCSDPAVVFLLLWLGIDVGVVNHRIIAISCTFTIVRLLLLLPLGHTSPSFLRFVSPLSFENSYEYSFENSCSYFRVQVDRNIAALAHNDFYWFMTEDFDHQAVLKQ